MIEGKELLDYTLNQIGGDKFEAIYKLAEELIEFDRFTKRAISLINPLSQYSLLEDGILSLEDSDEKLLSYLKCYSYQLPIRYVWKRVTVKDGEDELIDVSGEFQNKVDCYRNMIENAMVEIRDSIECCDDQIKIQPKGIDALSIEIYQSKDIFRIYEV